LWLALLAGSLQAATPVTENGLTVSETIPGFRHNSWQPRDGVAPPIGFITQTPDGFLWLGGDVLQRFDGKTFETIPAPAEAEGARPKTSLVDSQGHLWIGYAGKALVATYRNGRLVPLPISALKQSVYLMAQTRDGAIWAWCGYGQLHRYSQGKWTWMDKVMHLPSWSITGMETTADGSLWLSTSDGQGGAALRKLSPGGDAFVLQPDRLARNRMSKARNGSIWISDRYGARQIRDGHGRVPAKPNVFAVPADATMPLLTVDRDGGVWQATWGEGLLYQARPSTQPLLLKSLGAVTSPTTIAVFADREGSVWVGTPRGLDQFVPVPISREESVPVDVNNGIYLAPSQNGDLYLLSRRNLYVRRPGAKSAMPIFSGVDGIRGLCSAFGGGVWLQQGGHVDLIGARREARLLFPDGPRQFGCAEDSHGRLWVRNSESVRWHDARGWHKAPDALKANNLITGPDGNVVFGTSNGAVHRIEGDRMRTFPASLVGIGAILKLTATKDAIFISGRQGTARLVGNTISRAASAQLRESASWSGLARDGNSTWLLSPKGLFSVPNAAFDRVFNDPRATLPYMKFSERHGNDSEPQNVTRWGSQMAFDSEGRLWFLAQGGAMMLTPDRIRSDSTPPIVRITSVSAGAAFWRDPAQAVELPKGGVKLRIAFSANSLTSAEGVRLWYQLVGQDADWIDAAGTREATYTNLQPGNYAFRVKASNADGPVQASIATLNLEQPPTLFQSWPFKALCALLILALLWMAYLVRLRIVSNRIHNKLMDRLREREHVARDIHDTLLQSVQALTLHVQIAINRLPQEEQTRRDLVRAMDRAEQGISEGRDRLRSLRRTDNPDDLEQAMTDLASSQLDGTGIALKLSIEGDSRPLNPAAWTELSDVIAELFSNIARHSQATHANARIQYQRRGLTLRISDDGKGIEPALAADGRPGHFGLQGMRERVATLNGTLAIATPARGGTEVTISIPPRTIFARSGKPGICARLRRLFTGKRAKP